MNTYTSDIGLKDIVYLVTDREQDIFIVTAITFDAGGGMHYELSRNGCTTRHYRCEIDKNINEVIRLGLKEEVDK